MTWACTEGRTGHVWLHMNIFLSSPELCNDLTKRKTNCCRTERLRGRECHRTYRHATIFCLGQEKPWQQWSREINMMYTKWQTPTIHQQTVTAVTNMEMI
jgi:hypothetical protein